MATSLHIGVDAWNLTQDQRGIGRYVRMILSRWLAMGPDRVRCTLIIPETLTWIEGRRYQRALDFGPLPVRSRAFAGRCGFDAMWFPWNGLSWTAPGIKVATVHDAFFFAWPPAEPGAAQREQAPMRAAARDASVIITDSAFSKSELVRFLGLQPDVIEVVHLGVDTTRFHGRVEPTRFDGADRYVLFVGELERRKGVDTLIDAMAQLPADLRDRTVVAVAGRLSGRPDLHGSPVPPPPPTVRLELLGHVSDERLLALYAGAAAFVFPSRYEGFGLPVLEAMACGAPVVASDAASIPEAGGDAAIYFPTGDAAALAAALERVFRNPTLADELRRRGRRHAAEMSWDVAAERTLQVFERAVAARGALKKSEITSAGSAVSAV